MMEHVEILKNNRREKCPICFAKLSDNDEENAQINLRALGQTYWVCEPCGEMMAKRLAKVDTEADYKHIPSDRLLHLRLMEEVDRLRLMEGA